MPSHVLRDGRLTHRDSQLLKFSVDPRRTPQRVGGGHLADQGSNVLWYGRPPDAVLALPCPEQAKTAAVSRDDRLWLHDVYGCPPADMLARATPKGFGRPR